MQRYAPHNGSKVCLNMRKNSNVLSPVILQTAKISIGGIIIFSIILLGIAGCLDTSVKSPGKPFFRIRADRCTSCEKCIPVCPPGIITKITVQEQPWPIIVIDTDKCIGCGECASACIYDALDKEFFE